MRTKTLCLAAAGLLGGMLAASAQNVYSLNIVGYVNKPLAGGFNLVANPLDDGVGNVSSNLVPASLPTKSQIIVYDASAGYLTATKKTTGWDTNFILPPGKGYFVKVNTNIPYTNTYVGNVAGAFPGSVTNTILGGFNLVGSPYPIASGHTNGGSNTINLPSALPTKSQVIVYDTSAGYLTATKKTTGWDTNFNISVASGFFIKNNTNISYPWTQNVGP